MNELESIEKSSDDNQIETNERKIPKSVPFIVSNIFFERYCTAGVLGEKKHVKIQSPGFNGQFILLQQFFHYFYTTN